MLGLDALELARIQFAFTVSFHIVFPAISIGLASYLAVLEALWLRTGRQHYWQLFEYWKTIFAVTFGMGVVSGIVMAYQFGTNWSVFSDKAGPVIGPLMGYEVLSAFFLEAGFLGVMLFGANKVGPRLHFAATLMVAIGTLFSAFWILSVNSWMQTPAGFAINDQGQFIATDWWAVVFNPSFPYRLTHMVLAAYLTTAFIVAATGAWHLLKDSDQANAATRTMFSMAIWMATLIAPIQILAGDLHGLNTLEHQPAKIAAMEGHYETTRRAPLYLFGIPDDDNETLKYAIGIPVLGSLILTHDPNGELRGLKSWPPEHRPKASLVFWSFRVMVAIGFAMAITGAIGLWLRWRQQLYWPRWWLKTMIAMGPSGIVAVLAGWITTEVGRQPWTIYGHLLTSDSASPLDAPAVGASLVAFIVVYLLVFGAGVIYLLRLMSATPTDAPALTAATASRAAGITPGPSMKHMTQAEN